MKRIHYIFNTEFQTFDVVLVFHPLGKLPDIHRPELHRQEVNSQNIIDAKHHTTSEVTILKYNHVMQYNNSWHSGTGPGTLQPGSHVVGEGITMIEKLEMCPAQRSTPPDHSWMVANIGK